MRVHVHRAQPPLNAFDMARLRMEMPVKRPPSNTRALNKQIIHDFNQLKYRGKMQRAILHMNSFTTTHSHVRYTDKGLIVPQ